MPEHFDEGLEIALIGAFVAFAALTLIALVIGLIGRLEQRGAAAEASGAQASPVRSSRAGQAPNIDDLTLVLICSAVTVMLQGRGRVRHIRRVGQMTGSWAMKGRVTVQGSHTVSGHHRS